MFSTLAKAKVTYVLVALFAIVGLWWASIDTFRTPSDTERYVFNLVYGFLAVISFSSAIAISYRTWGGHRSLIGRVLLFLAAGLLLEWLGTVVWFFYNVTGADVPYPSLADIGYFGLVPMYILAAIALAKATGVHVAIKNQTRAKVLAILLPAIALAIAIGLFLRNVGYSGSSPLRLFFDIGYPVGEIIPITIALLILFVSSPMLRGGMMRGRVLWLVGAFFAQFLAEYVFLYQAGAETYVNAGSADMLYAISYFIMGLGVISFSSVTAPVTQGATVLAPEPAAQIAEQLPHASDPVPVASVSPIAQPPQVEALPAKAPVEPESVPPRPYVAYEQPILSEPGGYGTSSFGDPSASQIGSADGGSSGVSGESSGASLTGDQER